MHKTFTAILTADWQDALFLHFPLNPGDLQPHVPLPLDLFDGFAYVSLVAFRQHRLRPTLGGRVTELLSTPLARHEFLNVRTYVTHHGEGGIYFLAEWIPNRLAATLGPLLYGLPYRLARSRHDRTPTTLCSNVRFRDGHFHCHATVGPPRPADRLSTFLVERYTAYTGHVHNLRRFRITHAPWPLHDVLIDAFNASLPLPTPLPAPACAHFSPGVFDVAIGLPSRVERAPVTFPCTPTPVAASA